MHSLKKNTHDLIKEDFGRNLESSEKEDHNVYLTECQWSFLDDLAEEWCVSRNEVLRRLLASAKTALEKGEEV